MDQILQQAIEMLMGKRDPLKEILHSYVEMIGGALCGAKAFKHNERVTEKELDEETEVILKEAKVEVEAICERVFGDRPGGDKITKIDKVRLFHLVHERCTAILAEALAAN